MKRKLIAQFRVGMPRMQMTQSWISNGVQPVHDLTILCSNYWKSELEDLRGKEATVVKKTSTHKAIKWCVS